MFAFRLCTVFWHGNGFYVGIRKKERSNRRPRSLEAAEWQLLGTSSCALHFSPPPNALGMSLGVNSLIQREVDTCQGHAGASGTARMEPGLPTPASPSPSPGTLPPPPLPRHLSQRHPTFTLCCALGNVFTYVLFVQHTNPARSGSRPRGARVGARAELTPRGQTTRCDFL